MHQDPILRNLYFSERHEHQEIGPPCANDGAEIAGLVHRCKPLDVNSTYAYLLLCTHFAKTCAVARENGALVGFISAYKKPTAEDTLFIWQVAVSRLARHRGIANRMLRELVLRPHLQNIRFIETTIGPANEASKKLFFGFSREIGSPCEIKAGFPKSLFKREKHEDEYLFRIGPLNHKENIHEPGHIQPHGVGSAILRSFIPNGIHKG